MTDEVNPPARGVRMPWEEVAQHVREEVEDFLGAPVAEAVTQDGGFSPAAAVRLRLKDGRRAFVKALSFAVNPDSPDIYRAEARIAAALPADVPAPKLLTSFERDGWIALIFEDVEGHHPVMPWRRDELDRVRAAITVMSEALTPSPIEVPTLAEVMGDVFSGWRRLLDEDTGGLDAWALAHLKELAELESGWEEAGAGDTLLHADLRADNILLTGDRVYFVDWPWACRGAAFYNHVGMLPSVAMQGGPQPWELLTDPDPAITAVLAAVTGYFVRQGRQPSPVGLPTLRAFQRAQGVVSLEWLRRRLSG